MRYDEYWAAIASNDREAAMAAARAAISDGVTTERVLEELVVAAQREVGLRWAAAEWTVAREHAATAIGEHVVGELGQRTPEPDGPLLLVACVEREWHALPALVLAAGLRLRGHRIRFLGSSVPRQRLVTEILELGPRAVLLSASLTSSLARVSRQVEAVRGTATPVLVGGSAFDEAGVRARRLGATAHATGVEDATEAIARLPRHVEPSRPLRHPGADEARSISVDSSRIAEDLVDAVLAGLSSKGPAARSGDPDHWSTVLATHARHVLDALESALLVEDPTVLAAQRTWMRQVLDRRGAPSDVTDRLWTELSRRVRGHPLAIELLRA